MNADVLRKAFLDFFKEKGHTIVPSDSLVPAKDPTLLFTGAGMNQFKDYFLGLRHDMKRAASIQKCFRTGDVEQVGLTPTHLTFFEMMGNFSFGDYFKEEACRWAWEFLTDRMELSPQRLWVSVYEEDDEASDIWCKEIGVPAERIVRFGAKENFWPSDAPTQGPNGPCGPCSEIYYDFQRCWVGKACPNPEACMPGCPCGRFVEIWNLVFTQFDRQPDGTLRPLPSKNIDTGMGLERLAAVKQDKMSVFETDLFEPIVEEILRTIRDRASVGFEYSLDRKTKVFAMADHVRALTFLVADGVIPSNEGRGYVLRMLLRKAARSGRQLGLKEPCLYRWVPVVVQLMGKAYPELIHRRESIAQVIQMEEKRFHQTLMEKLPLLDAALDLAKGGCFSAQDAARFYDTHGVAYEEIVQRCAERNIEPPHRAAFDEALARLQTESKQRSLFTGAIFAKDTWMEAVSSLSGSSAFVGYDTLKTSANVVGIIQGYRLVPSAKAPAQLGVVLDRSPFYGEGGGQVGDVGTLLGPEGILKVTDTQWVGNWLVHRADLIEGRISVADRVEAHVDEHHRLLVARHHTATHLLHAALRKVLGPHVVQSGSHVGKDRLRLDFSHGRALTPSEREAVEDLVNEWVAHGHRVEVNWMPLEEAKRMGALAFFGEKYGAMVRVVLIGDVSKELCAGTHLPQSTDVGLLTIVEEGSVASGIRRVEAVAGPLALEKLKHDLVQLQMEHERLLHQHEELIRQKASLEGRA